MTGQVRSRGSSVPATIAATGLLALTATVAALVTARTLGPSDRGVVVIVSTSATFLLVVLSLGCGTGMRVLVNAERPLSVRDSMRYVATLSAAALVVCLLCAGILVVGDLGGDAFVLLCAAVLVGLQVACYLQREVTHGLGRHVWALAGETIGNALLTVVVLVAYSLGRLSLEFVLVAMVGAVLLQATLLGLSLRRAVGGSPRSASEWRLLDVIRYSSPAMFGTLGQSLVSRGDRLILGVLVGSGAVGVYGVAATMAELLALAPLAVSQVEFRRASISRSVAPGLRILGLTCLSTAAAALILVLICPFLIDVLLGPAYADAVAPTRILAAAAIPFAGYTVIVATLNGLGQLRKARQITVTGVAVLVIGSLVLCPRLEAVGAGLASLASYVTIFTVAYLHLGRLGRKHPDGGIPGPSQAVTPSRSDRARDRS